jgi:hypothetical protein
MKLKLIQTIEFPSADCEDVFQTVQIIVQALVQAGIVQSNDHIRYQDNHETVKVYIFRPQSNGDGDAKM